jgi:hypothetical protein
MTYAPGYWAIRAAVALSPVVLQLEISPAANTITEPDEVCVGVAVGVGEGRTTDVGVGEGKTPEVGVGEGRTPDVGVADGRILGVGVALAIAESVAVGVAVEVAVGAVLLAGVTISWGAFAPDSLLAKLVAVALVLVMAKLNSPSPVISVVTSTCTQVPLATGPDEPAVAPKAGALEYVMVLSPQVLSATGWRSKPIVLLLLA